MAFTEDDKKKIISALQTKGVSSLCTRCGHQEWILAESYTPILMQPIDGSFQIGGPMIPAITLVCKHCGHIELHASRPLAGLPEEQKK